MKNRLKDHIGEVVRISTHKEVYIALIVKIYYEEDIVKLNANHSWFYIKIEDIKLFGQSNEKIEDHVVPNAFT